MFLFGFQLIASKQARTEAEEASEGGKKSVCEFLQVSSKFKSFGNYLKHVIIFGCLYEVNILVLKSRLKSTWRLFNVAYFTYSRDQIQFSPSPPSAIIRLFLLLCLLWRVGEEGSTEQKRREGCLLLSQSFFFFFFAPCIPLSNPLFILEVLILQQGERRGGESREGWRSRSSWASTRLAGYQRGRSCFISSVERKVNRNVQ